MTNPFDPPRPPSNPPPMPSPALPRRPRALVITIAVLFVSFLLISAFTALWTERLWFQSVGYTNVFTTLLTTRIGLFVLFGALMAASVAINMAVAYRFRPFFRPAGVDHDNLDRYREAIFPIRYWLLVAISLLMGGFAGSSAAGQWRQFALWRNSEEFGATDPFFDRDIGFYVFQLPWLHYLVDFVMAMAIIGLMASAVVHYVYGGIRLQAPRERLSGAAQAQFSALLGLFVTAKAVDYYLDRFDLLSGSGSVFTGMGYTDANAVWPARNILTGIAAICAVLFLLNVWRRTWLISSVGLALLALSAVLLGVVWPGVVQRFEVSPSLPDKESPYITANIEATRAAFGLENVDTTSYNPTADLGSALDAVDQQTSSVPMVDPQLVRQTFEQQQQVRAFYSVANVLDVDRYRIDDKERALVLGVRELDQQGLAESDRNWSNLHTVYTHGNGVIAAYANQRGEDDRVQTTEQVQWAEGQEASESALTDLGPEPYEPRIYFGETSPSYSIVGRSPEGRDVELDLPRVGTQSETTTSYDGQAGVSVGSLPRKLLYAIRFSEPNIVLSSRVHENSKILYDRHPRDMVMKVAPWLTVDNDPYPAVIDGRVQWILDGYTVTDKYPMAQKESLETMTADSLRQTGFQTLPTDEINYMRNSVKATVDAYDGTVRLYAWDESDPILAAWRGVFPDTVLDRSEISETLMQHLRYPEDLFKVQRYQYARYHVTDAKNWYEAKDRWAVPMDPASARDVQQPPYRLFVNHGDDSDGEVYSLTSVYVPRGKNNLAAFVSVNSDATREDYGQIRVLELPNERTSGPGQIANEFASDAAVRAELFKFEQGGSEPLYGNMLTLPVGDGLMYVQPLYARRTNSESSYPILQFALVSYGGRVGIDTTLRGAIARVLDQEGTEPPPLEPPVEGPGQTPTEEPATPSSPPLSGTLDEAVGQLLRQAEQKFAEADAAQRRGDTVAWAEALAEARDLVAEAVDAATASGSGGGASGGNSGDGNSGDGNSSSGNSGGGNSGGSGGGSGGGG